MCKVLQGCPVTVGDIGRRRGERREERRNIVGLKHALILGKSINIF